MVGCATLGFLANCVWTSGALVGFAILTKKKTATSEKVCRHGYTTEHDSKESQIVNPDFHIGLYLEQISLNPSDQS